MFEVGGFVCVKLQSYRKKLLAKRPFGKLTARFYRPFEVLKWVRQEAYKLHFPNTSILHEFEDADMINSLFSKFHFEDKGVCLGERYCNTLCWTTSKIKIIFKT